VGEAVAGGVGFDDVVVEGESVDDRGGESGVGEGFGSAAEGLLGASTMALRSSPTLRDLGDEIHLALVGSVTVTRRHRKRMELTIGTFLPVDLG
jgi:hypothetical protein